MGSVLLLAPFLIALACVPFALPFGGNLEYEYATVTGWLVLLGLPLLGLVVPRRLVFESLDRELPQANRRQKFSSDPIKRLVWMFAGAPIAVAFPGILAFATNQCSCSKNGYVFWMMIQVVPAVWLGMGLFWLVLRIRCDGVQVRLRLWGLFAVISIILLISAGTLWFGPQKRIVALLLGFIHGPIYDQWIPVDHGVVLSRMCHGLMGWWLAWMGWRGFQRGWRSSLGPLTVLAMLAVSWYSIGSYPSIGTGKKTLNDRLPQEMTRGVLTMHYEGSDAATEKGIRVLMNEASFYVEDLTEILGVQAPRPIDIYVYPSDDVKKSYFGGGLTDVTDVWSPSIHVTIAATPHPNLRHELVHAVASQFGWNGLGFHPNMLITEGLAVALAPTDERFDLDEASASILKSGRIKRIEGLFSPTGFWSQSGGRAYTIAGSFLGYLLRVAGPDVVHRIYAGESIAKATNRPLKDWVKDWRANVEKKFDPAKSIENEALFRSPGILRDICPHTRADYARSRTDNIWLRLRQPPGWDPARWLEWRSQLSPRDLYVRVELWKERIKVAAAERGMTAAAMATWLETVQKAQRTPPKTIEDIELGMLESDLLALQGRRVDSQKKLDALISAARLKPPGELIERQLVSRQRIEASMKDDAKARDWRRYLAGWRTLPEATPDDPWIAVYLRMRRERNPTREQVLSNALMPVEEMDPSFRIEWYRITAGRLLAYEDYENAAQMYRELLKIATGGRKTFYEMQLRMATALQKPL